MKTWSTPVREENSGIIPCPLCSGIVFKHALTCEGFGYVRCQRCGLVQMNPQPVKDEIIARYSDVYGADYLHYEIENEKSFLELQRLALKDSGFARYEKSILARGEASVLDVGCATGSLLADLRGRGWRVTGVEISPCAGYAQKERGLDIKTVPLEECNFPQESFDAVLASHLIEHLNDPRLFFKEVHRILKKDGRVFITTPNISGLQAKLYGGKWRSAIFDHLCLFSKKTLTKMLNNTGFKTEKVSTWGGLAAGAAPKWLKKPMDKLAKPLGFGDVMIVRGRKLL